MRSRPLARIVTLIGVATAGLLGAHELDYRLIVPDPADRHDLLLRTGHGPLTQAIAIAVAVGVVAAFVIAAHGMGSRARHRGPRGWLVTACVLAAIQGGGFIVLESVERLLVQAAPDPMTVRISLIGVLFQVLTATAGTVLLRASTAVARALVRLFRARRRRVGQVRARFVRMSVHTPSHRSTGRHTTRAPPLLPV